MKQVDTTSRSILNVAYRRISRLKKVIIGFGLGVTLGALAMGAFAKVVFIPDAQAKGQMRAERRDVRDAEADFQNAYFLGATDLLEGKLEVQDEVERAFILIRSRDKTIHRMPVTPENRGNLMDQGWLPVGLDTASPRRQ